MIGARPATAFTQSADECAPKVDAKGKRFARTAKHKQAMNVAGQDVLNETFDRTPDRGFASRVKA